MATSRYKIAEQVWFKIAEGYPSVKEQIQLSDIIVAVGQKINQMFQVQQFTANLPNGETIPDGLCVATYTNIPVTSTSRGAIAKLPVTPIMLPKNMGILEIIPSVIETAAPLPTGSLNTLPLLTTNAITSITSTTAISGGNITDSGTTNIIARGVCWSTSPNPTTANNITNDGVGVGSYSSAITGLTSGTTYYVRAYAINTNGISYGQQVSFVATSNITLTTISQSNYTANKSTTKNIIYILKVVNSSSTNTIVEARITGSGTFVNGDLSTQGLELYTNAIPSFDGNEVFIKASSSWNGSAPQTADMLSLSISLTANQTIYLIFSLNINPTATTGHTFNVNGLSNPVILGITGLPTQVNNQTNVGATVTVGT